ncbi:MAG: hypothetical protein KF746_09100 [Chitinophagaceae bacterium]|nr:hypothetical protein [Chitinophagaceae bacterium]
MKEKKYYLAAMAFIMLAACVKKMDDVTVPAPSRATNADNTELTRPGINSCAPDYGDSILCYQYLASGKDYKVSPLNNPGKGQYFAQPEGLIINSSTGEINVTKSESGLAFRVGFIAEGSSDTCFTKVITSGVNYMDGVYVLENNDTLAIPIYNGDVNATPVCGAGGLFSDCEFDDDEDDDNGNGIADEPPPGQTLNSKNIRIDPHTGVISLRRSVLDGIFGTLNPANGKTVEATLYYRLNDCSNKALRKIDLKFTYYSNLSDVPGSLINDITDAIDNVFKWLFPSKKEKASNPRPPHIVIVANR